MFFTNYLLLYALVWHSCFIVQTSVMSGYVEILFQFRFWSHNRRRSFTMKDVFKCKPISRRCWVKYRDHLNKWPNCYGFVMNIGRTSRESTSFCVHFFRFIMFPWTETVSLWIFTSCLPFAWRKCYGRTCLHLASFWNDAAFKYTYYTKLTHRKNNKSMWWKGQMLKVTICVANVH